LNIAFFVTKFPSLSETFIANQVIALQNTGHTVHIFSQQKPPANEKMHQMITDAGLLKNTFYLSDIPQARIGKIKKLLYKLISNAPRKSFQIVYSAVYKNSSKLSVYELVHFLDKPEYNVLHAHFGLNGNYVTELLNLGLYSKAKFITTFHGYDLDQKLKENNFYSALFSACSLFTVNTNYSKNLLVKLGCEENKIKVLPVGFDSRAFKKTEKKDATKEIQLLFVGRLIKLKGPLVFVKICQLLKEKNAFKFKAVIIGEGAMFEELKAAIKLANLNEVVKLVGGRTQEKVIQYMDHSDIFILPGIAVNGLSEAQGLVIQEAQAMQLPVLISDAGGMAEGIQDGITGFVLKQNDAEAFAEKIELLVNHVELRQRMGEAGKRLVEDKYDIMGLNEKLINLYQK
jgi:colanic acid/amylovoran biosynthesis glycosyltransferase